MVITGFQLEAGETRVILEISQQKATRLEKMFQCILPAVNQTPLFRKNTADAFTLGGHHQQIGFFVLEMLGK